MPPTTPVKDPLGNNTHCSNDNLHVSSSSPSKLLEQAKNILKLNCQIQGIEDDRKDCEREEKRSEAALQKRRVCFEKKRVDFHADLQRSEQRVQAAVKEAEECTSRRLKRAHELRSQKQKADAMEAEIAKNRKHLEEFTKYRNFLSSLVSESDSEIDQAESEDPLVSFQHPQQLEETIGQLEEETLTLLTIIQDSNAELEAEKHRLQFAQEKIRQRRQDLDHELDRIKTSISTAFSKSDELEQQRLQQALVRDNGLLQRIREKALEVYQISSCRSGSTMEESAATPNDAVELILEQIETDLDILLRSISELPTSYLIPAEMAKEKKRRELLRLKKKQEEDMLIEEKRRRALEQALEPPKKTKGKPKMY